MNEKGICLTAVYPQAMYDSGLLKELLEKTAVQGVFNCVEFYFEGKRGIVQRSTIFIQIKISRNKSV